MSRFSSIKLVAASAVFAAGLAALSTGSASAGVLSTCEGTVSGLLPSMSIEGVGYATCMVDSDYHPGDATEKAAVENVFGGTFVLIGKSEDAGNGIDADATLIGSFSMLVNLFDPTDEIAIIMKTGGGQSSPSDAVFGLWTAGSLDPLVINPGTEYNGNFNLTAWGTNVLSHMSVYVREGEDCCDREVPEPGPLGLLGAGMIALYVARRRHKA